MNAGLSNLDTLKKTLLANSMKANNTFDAMIICIGLGMAGQIESLLNRKLMRMVGCVEVLPADRNNFLLSRFPLEAVTLTERKIVEADGWVAQDTTILKAVDLANGIVNWKGDCDAGPDFAQVRFTYTGGYFWDTSDEKEKPHPIPTPDGANLLPEAIRMAWLLQCQQVWAARDKLGLSTIDEPEKQSKVAELKLSPMVKEMLTPFIRYNLV